jgi:hypothetical protein
VVTLHSLEHIFHFSSAPDWLDKGRNSIAIFSIGIIFNFLGDYSLVEDVRLDDGNGGDSRSGDLLDMDHPAHS